MNVAAVIAVSAGDVTTATEPIAGRAWIAHLVDRLRRARAVSDVVVVCPVANEHAVRDVLDAGTALVASHDSAHAVAHARCFAGLTAVCPVSQLFVDPAQIDLMARLDLRADIERVRAVAVGDSGLALAGGAYLDLLTPAGLRVVATGGALAADGTHDVALPLDPPELRLGWPADRVWAITLQEALLTERCDVANVDRALTSAGVRRFAFWRDATGPAPRRVLVVRCVRTGTFTALVRHLQRVPEVELDVLCPAPLADDTRAWPGVRAVWTFDGPAFALEAVPPATLTAIRARAYDLCVVPRRTACGGGYENVVPMGRASGARVAVWLDAFGQAGLLAGVSYAWDPAVTAPAPWDDPETYRQRAVTALRRFGPMAVTETGGADFDVHEQIEAITARIDEDLACHALLDNADAGIDLDPTLIVQMPAAMDIDRALTRLTAGAHPATARLNALAEAAFVSGVHRLAASPPGEARRAAAADVRAAIDRLASLLTTVDHAGAQVPPDVVALDASPGASGAPVWHPARGAA